MTQPFALADIEDFQPILRPPWPTKRELTLIENDIQDPTQYYQKALQPDDRVILLYLARHGDTDLNDPDPSKDRIRGHEDVGLNSDGREEAIKLQRFFQNKDVANPIYSSDLVRTEETAFAIARSKGLEIVTDSALRPWDVGKFTGSISSKAHPILEDYVRNKPDERLPGNDRHPGESFNEFKNRFLGFLKELFHWQEGKYRENPSTKPLLLVSHFRDLKCAQAWINNGAPDDLSIDLELFLQWKDLPPGSLIIAEDTGDHIQARVLEQKSNRNVVTKGKGQPCKQGETADKSGCIPSEGSKKGKSKPKKNSTTTNKAASIPSRKEQDESVKYLKGLLGQIASMMAGRTKITPPHALVLQYGKQYYADENSFPCSGKQKECYSNVGKMVLGNPSLTYVEGYTTVHGVPIEHAWAIDSQGRVIDPTISPVKGMGGFFGIPFNRKYLLRTLAKTGYYGLISHTNPDLLEGKDKDFLESSGEKATGSAKYEVKELAGPNPKESLEKFTRLGIKGDESSVLNLVGAIKGRTVNKLSIDHFESGGYERWNIDIQGDGYEMSREIRSQNGKLIAINKEFHMDPSLRGKRVGTTTFAQEVKELKSIGVDTIVTKALCVRSGNEEENSNGCYTWARLGYDATFDEFQKKRLPTEYQDVETIQQLFRRPGGMEWWRGNGWTMNMSFDLREGSESLKILNSYLDELQKR